jgi:hypothetical protein
MFFFEIYGGRLYDLLIIKVFGDEDQKILNILP